MKAYPLGNLDLPVTFGSRTNYRTEALTFEVVYWKGAYHAILGRPAYAKFMAVPNYTYLKLKLPGPNGVITVSGSFVPPPPSVTPTLASKVRHRISS